MDIDTTLLPSFPSMPTPTQFWNYMQVRRRILELGGFILLSARTPEFMMSSSVYNLSCKEGDCDRPPPKLNYSLVEKRHIYWPIETDRRCPHNPDAIGSMGVGIYLRHGRVFKMDKNFDYLLGGAEWRPAILKFLHTLDVKGDILSHLAPIEYEENYHQGITDVFPLPYRIQCEFLDEGKEGNGLAQKMEFKKKILESLHLLPSSFAQIALVDESNPKNGRYVLYLLPHQGTKDKMVDYMLAQTARTINIPTKFLKSGIVGDSMTDFGAICIGGLDSEVKAALVGDRFGDVLWDPNADDKFAGEKLLWRTYAERNGMMGRWKYHRPPFTLREITATEFAYPGAELSAGILKFLDENYR